MSNWDAEHYLRYGNERTRAAADLSVRIKLDAPTAIADLGCGPGNSTQILLGRWPNADIVGIDSSTEMLQSARQSFPEQNWLLADVSTWTPDNSFDLLFSNAALQWIPDHAALMRHLFAMVAPGGALAFQIPSNRYATIRTLIHEISRDAAWNDRMDAPRKALTMESPSFYYDALAGKAAGMDIWETDYHHVMDSKDSIVDWIASTGLRPFLEVLKNDDERGTFLAKLRHRVNAAYESRADGKVLYPFCRTFAIAYR